MKAEYYAEATREMLQRNTDVESVLLSLRSLLTKKGHVRLYPRVLRELYLRSLRDNKKQSGEIIVAREKDMTRYSKEIDACLKNLSVTGELVYRIDSSLIGGYVVKSNNLLIDRSIKHRLIALYQDITH